MIFSPFCLLSISMYITWCPIDCLGAEIHCLKEELDKIYNIDLYDTTTEKDIHIRNELITRGMAWPDLSSTVQHGEERNSPQKEVNLVNNLQQ